MPPAFETVGIPAERVHLEPSHDEEAEGLGPILECWSLSSRNQAEDALAIADLISKLLSDDIKIRDPATHKLRRLCPGDVAILCRKNITCKAVAHAIETRGVRAVLPRVGLSGTLEGRVVLAGLHLWVDGEDSLAAAELAYLIEYPGNGDAWLSRAVETPGLAAFADCSVVGRLLAARKTSASVSPVEAVDAVIEATGVVELCHRWGGSAPRLANLESLRAHAVRYEDRCLSEGDAASTAGLVWRFADLTENDLDAQGVSTGNDAVTVSTWHRAKGLEWPITVLFELDRHSADRAAMEVQVVSDETTFNLDDPFANRWIRYWPYPYGKMSKGIPLLARLATHQATDEAIDRSEREEMRLLYVGWTRARDRLVLAARKDKLSKGVLGLLDTGRSDGVLDSDASEVEWVGRRFAVVRREGSPDVVVASTLQPEKALPKHEPRVHAPAWHLPSAQEHRGKSGQLTVLGERTIVNGKPEWDHLGNAVHGFFAADRNSLSIQQRRAIVKRLFEAWSVTGAVAVDDVVAMADCFWKWVDKLWPGAVYHREWPLTMQAEDGGRWVGTADLVIEMGEGLVLIDHKTFPGSSSQAKEISEGYWGQLDAYRSMLEAAMGKPVVGSYVHFPILGVAVPLLSGR